MQGPGLNQKGRTAVSFKPHATPVGQTDEVLITGIPATMHAKICMTCVINLEAVIVRM